MPASSPTARRSRSTASTRSGCAEVNAVDFGDLVMHCVTLWQSHPDVLAQYHRRFRHILVDEYQDTNVAQYLWLRLLAQGTQDVCCVGDDDQSIYGWRGAEVGNILRFEKDFPGATIVRLERNYRSTPHILAAASHLIAHNEGRLGKTLWTGYEGGRAHFPARRVGRRRGGAHGRRGDRGAAARQACARPDRHPGARRLPDPRVRGTVHHHGPALPGDRRAALLRAPGDPRRHGLLPRHRAARRRPRLRAHLQHAAPRPGRIGPAHAAHHPARAEGVAVRGDAAGAGDRRAEGPAAQVAGRPDQELRPLARHARRHEPCRGGRDHARRVGLHRHAAARPFARGRGPAGEPEGADQRPAGIRHPARLPRARGACSPTTPSAPAATW